MRFERNAADIKPRIEMALQSLTAALVPASPEDVGIQLEVIRTTYTAFAQDGVGVVADIIEDEWHEALGEYPLWAIESARKAWFRKDTGFPPHSSGQLMASVRPDVTRMRMLKRRADQAIAACEALTERTAA